MGREWLNRLEADLDNLRAATDWLEKTGRGDDHLRLAAALFFFWVGKSHYHEGRAHLRHALAAGGALDARARAAVALGWIAHEQGDLAEADACAGQAAALFRELGDLVGTAGAAFLSGTVLTSRGEAAAAVPLLEQVVAVYRGSGEQVMLAQCLMHLGRTCVDLGDRPRAAVFLEESLRQWRELGSAYGVTGPLESLADLALDRADVAEASARYREMLALTREAEHKMGMITGVEGAALIAAPRGQWADAARLLAAADAARLAIGLPRSPAERRKVDRALRAIRDGLDESSLAAATQVGALLPLNQAVDEASAVLDALATPAGHEPDASGLSVRELEVLRLVAQGHTDREIAETLFISRRTATTHLTHILDKLGLDSRTAAAAFAVRHGLA